MQELSDLCYRVYSILSIGGRSRWGLGTRPRIKRVGVGEGGFGGGGGGKEKLQNMEGSEPH